MRFAFIQEHRGEYPLLVLCRVLEVSRSGYYAWRGRPASARHQRRAELAEAIRESHKNSRHTYGSPRIHEDLVGQGLQCCVNTVASIMRQIGVFSKTKRKFKATTNSAHDRPVARNLLGRCFHRDGPNEAWASDVTYIPTEEGWLYLAVVIDLFSRKVIGYAMRDHLRTELVAAALQMAVDRRRPLSGLLLHSDRGVQYASEAYQEQMASHGIRCSMSRKADCWDNAVMESLFSTLKTELVHHERYATRAAARQSIFEYLEVFYNRTRRHSALGYVSPHEYETRHYA